MAIHPSKPFKLIFPPLYLLTGIFIDHYIPGTTILPSYCTIGLLAMSLLFSGRLMLVIGACYSLVVFGVFFDPTMFRFAHSMPIAIDLASYARAGTFFLVSAFCVTFSYNIQIVRSANSQLKQILRMFPYPIIISDKWGFISFATNLAAKRFNLRALDNRSTTFIDLFTPKGMKKSEYLSEYKTRFVSSDEIQTGEAPINKLRLEYQGRPMIGDTVILKSRWREELLTIIHE